MVGFKDPVSYKMVNFNTLSFVLCVQTSENVVVISVSLGSMFRNQKYKGVLFI